MVLNKEVEKVSLIKLQVEEVEKRTKLLKEKYQEYLSQNKGKLDAIHVDIKKLKGLRNENLQDKTN